MTDTKPIFSVIIATRDRPVLFKRALQSVLAQDFEAMDVQVVMDGSQPENLAAYDALFVDIQSSTSKPVFVHKLMHRSNGHGQSYSFNHGVSEGHGQYVTFLDDDDEWTDVGHLSRVSRAIEAAGKNGKTVQYIMCNQQAYMGETLKEDAVWLEDLEPALVRRGSKPYAENFYDLAIEDLFITPGFCHLNTSVVSKTLYQGIGGMDEGVRWECDRDLFLRLIEASDTRVFVPNIVSKHYIPDPKDKSSMTTRASMVQKRLFQIQVLLKALANTRNDTIQNHCRTRSGYAMKKLALELKSLDQKDQADAFSKMSQALSFSLGWPLEYRKQARGRANA
ncbi:MAG: glycosyltransferase family 2 protein [Pseudomonadota bacterium]